MVHVQYFLSVVTAVIELIFFSGLIFGWSSITIVLKEEGYFSSSCESTVNSSTNQTGNITDDNRSSCQSNCKSQDESLNLVFTIASFLLSLSTLPNGFIFDKFGTWVSRVIAIILFTSGALLLALASTELSVLLYPAMCGFAIGGILLLITNIQLGNLYPQFTSSIITLMNGSLDSSSVVFLIIKLAYFNGFSFNSIFIFVTCCTVFLWFRTLTFLPRMHISLVPPRGGYKLGLQNCTLSEEIPESQSSPLHPTKDNGEKSEVKTISKDFDSNITFQSCIKTWRFWTNTFHFSFLQLRNYFFFSSFYSWLFNILSGECMDMDVYLNTFGICQFFGIFCAPLNGLLVDGVKWLNKNEKNNHKVNLLASSLSAFVTSSWGVFFSILILVPYPQVQYVSFVLQVVFRSFLYGGNASFLAFLFPIEHFGKLYGTTMTVGGIITILQYPLYTLVLRTFDGNFLIINIIFLIACILTYIHPLSLYIQSKKSSTKESGCSHVQERFLDKENLVN